uniref:NAD(P)(+)--arginine ADP-ribosyltransferase n=1 Tax=Fundulus heteroclitus TaxID=8078 RepID=A0A3Q2QUK0_FUNHE
MTFQVFLFFLLQESTKREINFYEESIDDMYSHCKDKMEKMVFEKYAKELTEEGYGKHWKNEEKKINKEIKILTSLELQAIRVYTENKNNVYLDFNSAVRTGKNTYGTSFKFHILHFLLASALQKLKRADNGSCYITYRRDKSEYKKLPNKIRFGSFSSSSLTADQKDYGNETCFKIETCLGAKLEQYSAYPEEKEVLIPPYEVFTFVEEEVPELKDCKTVYLSSTCQLNDIIMSRFLLCLIFLILLL